MNKLEKIIGVVMVIFAVGFNLWLYRLEPTAKIDPNDNPFQYALVDRTNQMWNYAGETCGFNPLCFTGYLIDHWVPNWAEGYNLPYYYSHVPQIVIVATYRLAAQPLSHSTISLFQWYHILIYLLLCLFPITVFLALRIIRFPHLIAGAGALIASQISTDGLYGLDPSSFLWRGFGLTSQLFSMCWMPIAVALAFRFFQNDTYKREPLSVQLYHIIPPVHRRWFKRFFPTSIQSDVSSQTYRRTFWFAVLFLVLTISGHLGLGVMTLLSVGILAITRPLMDILTQQPIDRFVDDIKDQFTKLIAISGFTIFFLSYWIVPALLNDKYHNYSFWDPVWKFNSWGWKEVMQYFLNGNLFDFGRFPLMTILIIVGGFGALFLKTRTNTLHKEEVMPEKQLRVPLEMYTPFSFLFLFWLLMFFGRTTWGSLLDIIPSMKEFHQSRFIVGVHLAGFFLGPLGLWYLAEQIPQLMMKTKAVFTNGFSSLKTPHNYTIPKVFMASTHLVLILATVVITYPQTVRYSQYNDVLIRRGNENFDKQNADVETLLSTLKSNTPGRVFTGRGGSWGKKLQISETTYFMHLSTYGVPVILWLPETWSPNSDVEQFFIEEKKEHYDLLNVRYVVTPPDLEPQPFWEFMTKTPQWKLYKVKTAGYFGTGSHAAIISSTKFDFINLVRFWMQSDYPGKGIYPELTFNKQRMMSSTLPAFEMTDEASYKTRDGKTFGLFGEVPSYEAPQANLTTENESSKADMEFTTTVKVTDPCSQCMVFLKQSFHPNWHAWIDGKRAETFISFPFFTAVPLSSSGTHTVTFKYEPDLFKMVLFSLAILTAFILIFPWNMLSKKQKGSHSS